MAKCEEKCEVYSRVCGYFRPVSNWNHGKKEEFKDRKEFNVSKKSKIFNHAGVTCAIFAHKKKIKVEDLSFIKKKKKKTLLRKTALQIFDCSCYTPPPKSSLFHLNIPSPFNSFFCLLISSQALV